MSDHLSIFSSGLGVFKTLSKQVATCKECCEWKQRQYDDAILDNSNSSSNSNDDDDDDNDNDDDDDDDTIFAFNENDDDDDAGDASGPYLYTAASAAMYRNPISSNSNNNIRNNKK